MNARVVELSHPIHDGMASYPGLPAPRIRLLTDHTASAALYDGRATFAIGRVEFATNVGTYIDSPYHRFEDGPDVAALPLSRLVDLSTVIVDAREAAARGGALELVLPARSLTGTALLIRTGWDERWGESSYWAPGPYLAPATVEQLVHHRPALVGVDFWNVDDTTDPARPAHTRLLGEGIPIVEHLCNLGAVPESARSSFVPLQLLGVPSAPVRAFALVDEPWQEASGS